MNRLVGQVAIVTGGGGGIGSAVARRLAAEGARVVVNDIRTEAAVAVSKSISAAGGDAIAVGADVSKADGVDHLFAVTHRHYRDLSVLINNAGLINQSRHFLDGDEPWWDLVQTTNLKSVYLCSDRAARLMARRGGGAIVSTSSGGATRAHRANAAYDAAKGAIEAMTRAAAVDLAPYGIRVNAVAPGAIDMTSSTGVTPEEAARRGASIPLQRVGQPEDVAGAYAFLASEDSAYVTGIVIAVDGGMAAQLRSANVDVFGLDKYPVIARDS